jgi:hypothetical protein
LALHTTPVLTAWLTLALKVWVPLADMVAVAGVIAETITL